MKTFEECMQEVAKKYGLGKTLVTGHMVKYFAEAAEMYAEARLNDCGIITRPSKSFLKSIDSIEAALNKPKELRNLENPKNPKNPTP